MKHNICGYEWMITPDRFKAGNRCPNCANKKRKEKQSFSNSEFKSIVFNIAGDEYTVLGNYVNAKTPIKMKHNTCFYEWQTSPYHFTKSGTRCPKCSEIMVGKKKRKTHNEFVKEVSELTNSEYKVIGEYINAITKLDILHKSCGNIYNVQPNSFLNGNRCPYCSKKVIYLKVKVI